MILDADDDAVAVPGDRDDVDDDDTLHSNTAIWPKNTFMSSGSDSNIGGAINKEMKVQLYLNSNRAKATMFSF